MANPQAITKQTSQPVQVEKVQQLPAEQEIHQARARLSETTEQLKLQVRRTFYWREIVNRYPLLVTGLAAGAGAIIGFGIGPSSKRPSASGSGKSTKESSLVASLTTLAVREGTKYLIDSLLKQKR
jgi:ElaB/YqjD/DUF883 family membrane-anchored ribosome-binding protein